MNPLPPDILRNLVADNPKATLIVDLSQQIVCANEPACQLLDIGPESDDAAALFEPDGALGSLLTSTARTSGALPTTLRLRGKKSRLRVRARPLDQAPGRTASLFNLTFEARSTANRKMLDLKQKLDTVDAQCRKLLADNDALSRTVNHTLPRLRALTFEDALTGAKNKRFFDRQYEREWHRALRRSSPLTLLCIDVDHFKKYNDGFGHPEGDRCLKAVTGALEVAVTREFDQICRTGGEEFVALLPMTGEEGGIHIAHQVLSSVRHLGLAHPDGGIVTVSVGLGTCYPHMHVGHSEFLAEVDQALYCAKERGRNGVVSVREMQHGVRTLPQAQRTGDSRGPSPASEPERRHPEPAQARRPLR